MLYTEDSMQLENALAVVTKVMSIKGPCEVGSKSGILLSNYAN